MNDIAQLSRQYAIVMQTRRDMLKSAAEAYREWLAKATPNFVGDELGEKLAELVKQEYGIAENVKAVMTEEFHAINSKNNFGHSIAEIGAEIELRHLDFERLTVCAYNGSLGVGGIKFEVAARMRAAYLEAL